MVYPLRHSRRAGLPLLVAVICLALFAAGCTSSSVDIAVAPAQPAASGEPAPPPAEPTAPPSAPAVPPAAPEPDPAPTAESEPEAPPAPATGPEPSPDLLETFDMDPAVIDGTLDNGLRYLIRENGRPGEQAQIYLAVNAGSILEDEDQLGGAHFLEHMMFNGTEKYPANDLIRILEGFGFEFGADINAYTSTEETVYTLSVPMDDQENLALALDVLFEWSSNALIDPAEVVLEQGVVVDEWRLRASGSTGRLFESYQELLYQGTAYEDRLPIGTRASIVGMRPGPLKRFYDDYYRPDLMTIIAVGDIDANEAERLIVDFFGGLEPRGDSPAVEPVEWEPLNETRVDVLVDPDLPSSFVEVMWTGPSIDDSTPQGVSDQIALDVALDLLSRRLTDDIQRGDVAFSAVFPDNNAFGRFQSAPTLHADGPAREIENALRAMLIEIERAQAFGFAPAEFDLVLSGYRASNEQNFSNRGTKQDREFASELLSVALEGGTSPSPEDRYNIISAALDQLTIADVEAALDLLLTRPPAVLVVGPEDLVDDLPTEARVFEVLDETATAAVEARADQGAIAESLVPNVPEPAAIVDRVDLGPVGEVVEFENGVRIAFKFTNISTNGVSMSASSPGGNSLIPPNEVAWFDTFFSDAVPQIVSTSGAGSFDAVDLDRILADQVAYVFPSMDLVSENWDGEASTDDLETLFQLLYLYITAPRADAPALAAFDAQTRPLAENPDSFPQFVAQIELFRLRYGDSPYYRTLPTPADLDAIDLDRGLELFTDRYGEVGDWVFAFAGDFDQDVLEDLAARYLGSIPTTRTSEEFVNNEPPPPPGIEVSTVEGGEGEEARVVILFTEPAGELSAENYIGVEILSQIIQGRLTDRIRERLGASYAPRVFVQLTEEPVPLLETYIEIPGEAERLDEILAETLDEIGAIRSDDYDQVYFDNAIEILLQDYGFVTNPLYTGELLYYANNPDEDPSEFDRRSETVEQFTRDEVLDLATQAFDLEQYLVVKQVPVGG